MKVSIVTPCLNSEKTIGQTIESVLSQTYTDIEYIIVDGKSEDNTLKIIKEYMPLFHGRLMYISEKDDGIYDAMNKGIEQAGGEIIGIINSDDWYEADAVEQVVRCFETKDVDLIYGNMTVMSDGNKYLYTIADLDTIWYQMAIAHPAVFIKREIYNEHGLFNIQYRIAADYELLLRFYWKGVQFYYLDAMLANFRLGGISDQLNLVTLKETYDIAFKYITRCPYKEKLYPILKENYNFYLLENILLGIPLKFQDSIFQLFHKEIQQVVIFGTGYWGEKCYNALLQTNINVLFFMDNNKGEVNEFMGKMVLNPEETDCADLNILVAIRNDEDVIKQLHGLGAENVVTLKHIIQIEFEYKNEADITVGNFE